MALKYADRVAESTVSTGTGDINLAGAIDGDHATFASQFADGDQMPVSVFGGGKWMTITAQYNAGPNSISRIAFRRSSTGSNLVLSGTMTVLCGWGADDAGSIAAQAAGALRFDAPQTLTNLQKNTALTNVGAVGTDAGQVLTSTQKNQALANMGSVGTDAAQSLTTTQKAQANGNTYIAPTVTKLTSGSGATYTTPPNVLWLEVKMVGGGGGGAGGGTSAGNGGGGATTSFGPHSAPGGTGGTAGVQQGPAGGIGGTIGTGGIGREHPGAPGSSTLTALSGPSFGGVGGGSMMGPGGQGANGIFSSGQAAPANSGGGGGGGGGNNSQIAGASGAGGDGVDFIIPSPVATYNYTVGVGGAAGSNGANGTPGGAGGSGLIYVIEHYS